MRKTTACVLTVWNHTLCQDHQPHGYSAKNVKGGHMIAVPSMTVSLFVKTVPLMMNLIFLHQINDERMSMLVLCFKFYDLLPPLALKLMIK